MQSAGSRGPAGNLQRLREPVPTAMQGKPIGVRAQQLAEACAEDELVTAALRALPPQAATQVPVLAALLCCCMAASSRPCRAEDSRLRARGSLRRPMISA
jgi:hypothetical protein